MEQQMSRVHRQGHQPIIRTVSIKEDGTVVKKEKVTITDIAKKHGVENVRVFYFSTVPLRVFGATPNKHSAVVEGRIAQGLPNRDVLDDYKFVVNPLDTDYSTMEFYNADFESLSQNDPERYYVMIGEEKIVLGFQAVPTKIAGFSKNGYYFDVFSDIKEDKETFRIVREHMGTKEKTTTQTGLTAHEAIRYLANALEDGSMFKQE